ncbi:hypothetical protein CIHG_10513 [Coccidioides immitis H538.4]|uniref:Uncharacterized protein n=1 Tax=Coccidioides immitis H538.4 TaxID=396776 RepID=A0A0J8S6C2_COCIT|nr:hypothetical protein CIHG_10513 [Coccidioides immitis H538.4]
MAIGSKGGWDKSFKGNTSGEGSRMHPVGRGGGPPHNTKLAKHIHTDSDVDPPDDNYTNPMRETDMLRLSWILLKTMQDHRDQIYSSMS